MPRSSRSPIAAHLRWGIGSIVALSAGALTAFVAAAAFASSSPTLNVDRSAKVGSSTEAIAATSGSRAVYMLSGETTHHFLCTTSCFPIWIPVKAPSGKLTLAHGISGKLGTVSRTSNGKTFKQLTLSGHLLYTFVQDKSGIANGNGIVSFGGTWHVVKASGSSSTPSTSTPSTSTPTMTTTTTTPTYTYPPGY